MSSRFAGGPAPADGFPVPRSAPAVSHLAAPATDRRALGQALAALRPRPVVTVGDLLEHTPFRHEDYRSERTLAEMAPGEEATVVCTVERVRVRPTRRRNLVIVEAAVRDESGPGVVIWFNQRYLAKQLKPGMRLSIRGERRPTIDAEIVAKSYERADDDSGGIHTAGLVPVYPASEKVSSRQIRALADEVLRHAGDQVDPLPAATKTRRRLPLRRDALTAAHRPDTQAEAAAGMSRLAFDELYLLQLGMLERRARFEETARAHPLPPPGELAAQYRTALPFALTGAQERAVTAIDVDLTREVPMRRLLQGDVGSGKTAVAAHALVRAVEGGGQGALMAPTETLATQHLIGLTDLLVPLGVRVVALMQGTPAAERRAAVAEVGGGGPLVVVGTHALIQEQVEYGTLRVAVVDEQHRFGVEQRRALEEKSAGEISPHVLHMTATPIPRTLALTVYGDLDVSVLDEMPPGRTPVVTRVLPLARRDEVFARMRRLLDEGRQAYVVCPLVSESETDREAAAAESEAARLRAGELQGYAVAHLHGQMPVPERRAIMDAFRRGGTQVLVATTVIEVGVDVPNATLMVIEGADLFGLAQLHQLRGRVGRGSLESFCILLADPATDEARRRLDAMASTSDGFELAEVDLDLRGEGTVLAVKQSGIPDLRHARLTRHRTLAAEARAEAAEQLAADPDLETATGAIIAAATRRTFGDDVDWLAQA
ncbi:MAG TPA: ATP-dependent DNA helicase RecG [Gaiellales bacterium]|nr:ATP-dependent DNA helicase RecG [Gaiellales bacterium]